MRALETIKALPGVDDAAFARAAPYNLGAATAEVKAVGGSPDQASITVDWNAVSPDFFKTLGIPLIGGRSVSSFDAATAAKLPSGDATLKRLLTADWAAVTKERPKWVDRWNREITTP